MTTLTSSDFFFLASRQRLAKLSFATASTVPPPFFMALPTRSERHILPVASSVTCLQCKVSVPPTAEAWNPVTRLCHSCHHRRSELRPLTIRLPPRRLCTLCRTAYVVLSSHRPDCSLRCASCAMRERCSRCLKIKLTAQFRHPNRHQVLFQTCKRCRDIDTDDMFKKRVAAEAVGLRWCSHGYHRVSPASCTTQD